MKICLNCGSDFVAPGEQCPMCGAVINGHAGRLVGTTLADKYLIEAHLGTGGMCDVYQARHAAMGKQVAVKVLKPGLAADPKITERFEQEARAASRIRHPNAINVIDYGIGQDNTPFIVMELVQGETLGELVRRSGALPVEQAANILRQVCGALEAAHTVGVIHRDIKPDNIIIAQYNGSDWVQVVDFGVAKIQEDVNRRAALTGANIIVGTPRYMSPEQCDEKPVDARSDIYSLGVVLYEMLSGEAPFEGSSSTRLLVAHASEPPPPIRQKRPDLSPEIEAVVMRSLKKDPALRPQTALEFARIFEEAAGLVRSAKARAGGGAFSRIQVPLRDEVGPGSGQEAISPATGDEATLVRPRSKPQTPAAYDTPAFNTPPRSQAQAASPGRASVRTAYDYDRRSNAPWIFGLIALLLVAGIAGYLMFGDRLFGSPSTGDAVMEAQQAITDALARVDQLPKDHPLRTYLKQLAEWQGEMRAYQEIKEYNPQIIERAERYKQKAEEISSQARVAALSSSPVNPTNANGNLSSTPGSSQKTEAAKPAEESPTEEESEEEGEEREGEPQEKKGGANRNSGEKKKSQPPVIDPVKPDPESKPANANKPKNDRPPNI